MRTTRRTAVILAIIFGLAAAVLIVVYLRSLTQSVAPPPTPTLVSVPVPVRDLPAGSKLAPEMLVTKQLAPEAVPADAITDAALLQGEILAEPALAGQPLTRALLAKYSPQAGLSLSVPSGMRAVTVAVDNITGVGGFLKLGDRVDVLCTIEIPDKVVTKTVLQDILVLGVGAEATTPATAEKTSEKPAEEGQPAQGQAKQLPSVTLAVTPEQAQALVLSAKKGAIHLALRSKADSRMVALPAATNQTVLGVPIGTAAAAQANANAQATTAQPAAGSAPVAGQPATGAAAAVAARPGIEVLRGTNSREVVTP